MPGNFQCNLSKQQPETSAPLVTGTYFQNKPLQSIRAPESQERTSSNPTVRLNYALRQIKFPPLLVSTELK